VKLPKNPTREDCIRLSCSQQNAGDLVDEVVVLTLALDASRLATETAMQTIRRQVGRIQQLEIKLGGNL
jgi:hypothetical protein